MRFFGHFDRLAVWDYIWECLKILDVIFQRHSEQGEQFSAHRAGNGRLVLRHAKGLSHVVAFGCAIWNIAVKNSLA